MSLHIDSIRIDGGTQARAAINEATVAEYAEAMADENTVFPPIIAYFDGKEYWLADGFHRLAAWRQMGRTDVPAEVRQGDRRRAILHSVAANAAHGLRRTNDDKRRAVMTLLEDEEWSRWTDREIARRCGVHHDMVGRLRGSSLAENASERVYTTKHGTEAVMKTANIGRTSGVAPRPAKQPTSTKQQPSPSRPSVATEKPQLRAGRELTREALEADLAGALAEIEKLKSALSDRDLTIERLEREKAEAAHPEHGRVIADLQDRLKQATAAKGKKMDALAVEARRVRERDKRIADLEAELATSREREVMPL